MRGGTRIDRNLHKLFVIAIWVIAADQATKAVITSQVALNDAIEVIPGLFNIVYVRNLGAAFGILNDGSVLSKLFLIGVSSIALVLIGSLIKSSKDALLSFALSLIAGGAVGNLIDRVRLGYVIDFLDFYIGEYHWPAFNVADSAITVGALLALFSYLKETRKKGA